MIADREVTMIANGERVTQRVEPRQNLVDFLREKLGLTGSHVGCEHGVCGACTIRLNGLLVAFSRNLTQINAIFPGE
jgi:carbon-monoxide dehydrogenase small subunit